MHVKKNALLIGFVTRVPCEAQVLPLFVPVSVMAPDTLLLMLEYFCTLSSKPFSRFYLWVREQLSCKQRRTMDEMLLLFFVDHVALRHSRSGSVMIAAMTEVFKQYGNKWHIVDFFTKVSKFQVTTFTLKLMHLMTTFS